MTHGPINTRFLYVFTFMYLLQLSDRIASPLANRRFDRDVPDIPSLEISRRVERQTISLKEGGYEESTWNKSGTAGPVGPLEHGDSILGSMNLRVFGPAEQQVFKDGTVQRRPLTLLDGICCCCCCCLLRHVMYTKGRQQSV